MRLLAFLARYSRGAVFLAVLASALCGACTMASIALLNRALAAHPPEYLPWTYAAVCVLLPTSRFFSELLLNRLGQGALFDLRVRLSRKILDAPLRQLEEIGTPRLLTLLTEDLPLIIAVVPQLPVFFINVIIVLGGLLYMSWVSLKLMGLVMVGLVLGVLGYQLPMLWATRHFKLARGSSDELMGSFRALTQGTKELKLSRSRREAFLSDSLRAAAASFQSHNNRAMHLHAIALSWGQGLLFAVLGVMVFLLTRVMPVEPQVLTGYVLVLLCLLTPLQVIMNMVLHLSRARVAIDNVTSLGISLREEFSGEGSVASSVARPDWSRLELVGVTHAYRREDSEQDFVVGPIDLSIERGQLVFIVGGNGSGKTTLAKVLVGLYTPASGELRVDGVAVTDATRESYRHLFSVIFSDFFLFERLLGLDSAGLDERARHYLSQLQLEHKVLVDQGRFSTTELSQGQRKRLALLGAYLEDRPILLFDEWAADQDPIFKDIFYKQLLPELKARGKTVLVISHDDRYFGLADRILKLEAGKIVSDVPGQMDGEALAPRAVAARP